VRRALVIVDVQRDFYSPEGALYVPEGYQIIPEIQRLAAEGDYDVVVTTQDWHPPEADHFEKWPVHCVAGTPGAQLHPVVQAFNVPAFYKGVAGDDAYSGFDAINDDGETLGDFLIERGVTHVDIVGLALDYCVVETALDSATHFRTTVMHEAVRPVNWGTGRAAIDRLDAGGVCYKIQRQWATTAAS
jgi:nicotinamidase/pyrazinamidase